MAEKPQIVAFNKIDLPDVQKKWAKVKYELEGLGLHPFVISTLQRRNLKALLWEAFRTLESTPQTEEIVNMPVYRPEDDERAFKIVRLSDDGWRVKGIAIERATAMTYWEYPGSVRRFQRILEALGVDVALKKAGIKEGEIVKIGKHELEWTEYLDG